MEGVKEKQGQLVFGLDIGTRSIVGTVGYLNGGKFHVLAQRSKEHETRAMLDGQIHDIGKVGETISRVKEQLEEDLGRELTEVCIAAAGRVLRTVTTYVEHSFESDREITQDCIYLDEQKRYIERVLTNDRKNKLILCIMKDVTREKMREKKQKRAQAEAVQMADKLAEEQLRIVHEIASLLGETAADTKVAIEELKQTILQEIK